MGRRIVTYQNEVIRFKRWLIFTMLYEKIQLQSKLTIENNKFSINLIIHQPDIKNTYAKDPYEAKNQFLT